MAKTNTARNKYNPRGQYRGGSNRKMNELIKPFVRELENDNTDNKINFTNKVIEHFGLVGEVEGEGLTILPSDPNALIDRFDLLFTSQKAGHTGVRNEIISILDELKIQGVIKTNEYKKLNSIIKK